MAWFQITLNTQQDLAEVYSACLTNAGAVAVSFQDAKDEPLFEPAPDTTPLWQDTKITALFDANINIDLLKIVLQNNLNTHALDTLKIELLEDKDWIRANRDQFKPLRFGEKLMICPSWCENPDPSAITLMLDPGLAFGTGSHATTRLCLEWLDQHPPMDSLVIDYGCGSGILGIAALKLGARFVYAIDNDPQALLSTKQNTKNNSLDQQKIITLLPEPLNISEKADLILANILANPLITLAPVFSDLIKTDGVIVLSGFLEHQIDPVFAAYKPWFKLLEIEILDGWVRLSAMRVSF
jgi:ribosomal protein L11 methyltransferase